MNLWLRLKAAYRAFKTLEAKAAPVIATTKLILTELKKVEPFRDHGRYRVIVWDHNNQKHSYLYPLWKGQDSGAEARQIFDAYVPQNSGDYASFYDGDIERTRKTYGNR